MTALTRRQEARLAEALECLTAVPDTCCFWACPGPDVRYVPMATCRVCRAVQLMRQAGIGWSCPECGGANGHHEPGCFLAGGRNRR